MKSNLSGPPLNIVPKWHIYTSFKYLQGSIPRPDHPCGIEIFPNVQPKHQPFLVQQGTIGIAVNREWC